MVSYSDWRIFFSQIWKSINRRRKIQVVFLLILNFLSAFADVLSLASLIPFLAFLLNPKISTHYFPTFLQEVPDSVQLLLISATYFILVIVAGLIRMANLWLNNRLSFILGADIGKVMFSNTLNQDYAYLSRVTSSQIVDMLVKKSDALVSGGIIPIIQLISSSLVVVFTVALLFFVALKVSLALMLVICSAYYLIFRLNKRSLNENSSLLSRKSSELIRSIQEAILCKVEIILYKKQQFFVDKFYAIDTQLRRLESDNQFFMHSPKIGLEVLGVLLIAGIAIVFYVSGVDTSTYIPILATFGLASQKLLPNLQQIYAAIANINSRSDTLIDVITNLGMDSDVSLKTSKSSKILFNRQLRFEKVGYQYDEAQSKVFTEVNFVINKGDRLGIFGESGSGKTTLARLILGIEGPTEGNVFVDDQNFKSLHFSDWYSRVAYVPQLVPILDQSIEENIAFGENASSFDHVRIQKATADACFASDIEKFKLGYKSSVGEFGYKLSGGQKLKLGLARALYRQPSILLLDEYTSALDKQTEGEIVQIIQKLSREITIVVISHRPEAMSFCDKFLQVQDGKVTILDEI